MDDFDEFWRAFPRKVGKALCRSKFKKLIGAGLSVSVDGEKLVLTYTADELIKAAKAYAVSDEVGETELRFLPHPATWLNQGRFEDIDEDERDRQAAFYDRCQEAKKQAQDKRGLRVVR